MPYYYTYNEFLQKKFGCRVYKICIDGGFTCPNRDGSKGSGGCIFCDEEGSSSRTNPVTSKISDQIVNNIIVRKNRYGGEKFIAYFQSFSNTYGPIAQLKKLYDEAIHAHPDIVGLAISTRADCVDSEKLELIASYRNQVPYVCIEYGLQTIHDRTLLRIHRQEFHSDFVNAINLTRKFGIDYCAHVILGLPGETHEDMMQTAEKIAEYRIPAIKIHFLVIMEKTPLAKENYSVLSMEEAVTLTCDFLERIPPDCIIIRMGGNGHPLHSIAPNWVWEKKKEFVIAIDEEFKRRSTRQGSRFKEHSHRQFERRK